MHAEKDVQDWYEYKTESILAKYGPGPRVHFHIGLVPMDAPLSTDREELRGILVRSQEALLERATSVWDGASTLSGEIVDVGCGLGGPAIYWAQRFGGSVTGLTIAPGHVEHVERFALQAGVSDRVRAVAADATTWTTDRRFDTAIACESACYLHRRAWFESLSRLIRPGGNVFVEDTFLGHPDAATPFDAYWKTRIGTAREYVEAAAASGFRLESDVDLTAETTGFWRVSLAWIDAAVGERPNPKESARLERSREWHRRFLEMWSARAIEVRLLRFRREP